MTIHGVGIDLVELPRFQRTLDRTPSIRGRLFTPMELERCGDRVDRLAARFAAKEAVAKAMGTGIRGFAFLEIEVTNDDLGRPSAVLLGRAAITADRLGIIAVHLSLTTATETVAAYAVAER